MAPFKDSHWTDVEFGDLRLLAVLFFTINNGFMPSSSRMWQEWLARLPNTTRKEKNVFTQFRKIHTQEGPRGRRPIVVVSRRALDMLARR